MKLSDVTGTSMADWLDVIFTYFWVLAQTVRLPSQLTMGIRRLREDLPSVIAGQSSLAAFC